MTDQSSPQVPRGELSGRFAPRRKEKKQEHRSFGTIIETRGRFKVRYTGPDRKLHRAGMTFSTRERAQGWLSDELRLIEYSEWVKTLRRRIAAGKLRAYRYGPQVIRVDPNDVDMLMTPIRTLRSP